MSRTLSTALAILFGAALGPLDHAYGEVVHRWTDADGVTHFSDVPPESDTATLERIDLYDFPPPTDGTADYYSVVNQWERMRAEREARESQRLARERAATERRRVELEAAYLDDAGTVVSPRVPLYSSPWLPAGALGYGGRPGPRPYGRPHGQREPGYGADRHRGADSPFDHRFNATPSAFGRQRGWD